MTQDEVLRRAREYQGAGATRLFAVVKRDMRLSSVGHPYYVLGASKPEYLESDCYDGVLVAVYDHHVPARAESDRLNKSYYGT